VDKFCLSRLSQLQAERFGFHFYFGHAHVFFCALCSGHSLFPFEFHRADLHLMRISAGNIQHLYVSFIKWPIAHAHFHAARAEHSANTFRQYIFDHLHGRLRKKCHFSLFFLEFLEFPTVLDRFPVNSAAWKVIPATRTPLLFRVGYAPLFPANAAFQGSARSFLSCVSAGSSVDSKLTWAPFVAFGRPPTRLVIGLAKFEMKGIRPC